jgi:hypothetical protein
MVLVAERHVGHEKGDQKKFKPVIERFVVGVVLSNQSDSVACPIGPCLEIARPGLVF